jgi:uncharacterized membrane protein (UPF0182 family)
VLLGVNFWLDRFSAVQSNNGRWAGALYTDVNAVIPTKAILAVAAVLVAILFVVAAVIGRWRLPVIGTAMLVITSILAGGVYPWVIQQFQVRPSEETLEKESSSETSITPALHTALMPSRRAATRPPIPPARVRWHRTPRPRRTSASWTRT